MKNMFVQICVWIANCFTFLLVLVVGSILKEGEHFTIANPAAQTTVVLYLLILIFLIPLALLGQSGKTRRQPADPGDVSEK